MINKINSVKSSLAEKANNKNAVDNAENDIKRSDSSIKGYKKYEKYDSIKINKLISDNEKRINEFKETIRRMIVKQGEKSNLTLFGKNLNVSIEDSQKAAKSIADGGEYSIDAVATRIIDMAKALSGGDKSKIGLLKYAVKKGFKEAGLEFNNGAGLPDICNKTYDEIMKRFDEWEKE
ncbi:hypothetical protein [Sedimentibacter sp. MB31-C6]|uniref:hypothetical protein n=1 Tax=Sedimentibacter sp. MB31-C6 TaxID=3109366 RepID=UPI002DDCAA06|nr:hypothetical protein [Sedimentibacter sp. MB36-C1]WSI04637.1 hypothetical protein U8307_02300 [Sedimentibacter sp. MB36-C1]